MKIRLQKIIADAGLASRREAERWIEEGRVRVNGRVEKRLGTLADTLEDRVEVNGKLVRTSEERVFVMLNKPTACLTTTTKDARGRSTVMEYVRGVPQRVFPVGRLDYNTQGLLLFTNDGNLAEKLLDPKNKVERTYLVKVRGVPDEKTLGRIRRGVRIDNIPTSPVDVRIQRVSGKNCFLVMTLVEGKNRHVKKICEAVRHTVVKLQRTHFGKLGLGELPLGAYRFLSLREMKSLERLLPREPKDRTAK